MESAKREFTFLFPTLILERILENAEAMNRGLRALVLEKERTTPGVSRSNVGGWHSENDFFKSEAPEVVDLRGRVSRSVHEFVAIEQRIDPNTFRLAVHIDAWANVGRAGHYARPHVHANANVSGVYYVDAGSEDPRGGGIEFLDPRNRPAMFQTNGNPVSDIYTVQPQTGMLLLFPSFLYHYTSPYQGTGERLCIAFNVVIHELKRTAAKPG
jgi:uncharacterized protein (TIGR02466 family)